MDIEITLIYQFFDSMFANEWVATWLKDQEESRLRYPMYFRVDRDSFLYMACIFASGYYY